MTFVDPALSQGMEAPFREAVRANLPKNPPLAQDA
jgi:hypothetical protein